MTSKKRIYVVRHGQTDFNLKGIVQGSGVDSSLNDKGRRQAHAFYDYYRTVPFDAVYTSELRRTRESVNQFIEDGIPHKSFSGLNEISWGNKEGQVITPEEDEYYHWMLHQWQLGNTSEKIEGGESPDQVAARQLPALEYILSRTEEKNVLICMHGRAIRILLCQLLHYPLKSMDLFEHENLCLYLLNHTGTLFTVDKYCDTKHLLGINNTVLPTPVEVIR